MLHWIVLPPFSPSLLPLPTVSSTEKEILWGGQYIRVTTDRSSCLFLTVEGMEDLVPTGDGGPQESALFFQMELIPWGRTKVVGKTQVSMTGKEEKRLERKQGNPERDLSIFFQSPSLEGWHLEGLGRGWLEKLLQVSWPVHSYCSTSNNTFLRAGYVILSWAFPQTVTSAIG